MRNAERRLRTHDRKLRGKAARPEQRYFSLADGAVADILIAIRKIDADLLRAANMDRRAVDVRKTRCNLDGANGIRWLERPHRHDKRRFKGTGRLRRQRRNIDAGNAVLLEKRERNTRLPQRFLERKRAPECERHEVVLPILCNIGDFLDEYSIPENMI